MSKPYFAKYLPVEGEIKEDDMFFHEFTGTIMYSKGENWGNRKKAKLFLCSRNIQVGDITYEDGSHNPIEVTRLNHMDLRKNNINDYPGVKKNGKVVGEISKEALSYVKEGDEFEEDEVKIAWYLSFKNAPVLEGTNSVVWTNDKDGSLLSGIYFKRSEVTRWFPEKSTPDTYCVLNCDKEFFLPRSIGTEENFVKVKGPCGHFH